MTGRRSAAVVRHSGWKQNPAPVTQPGRLLTVTINCTVTGSLKCCQCGPGISGRPGRGSGRHPAGPDSNEVRLSHRDGHCSEARAAARRRRGIQGGQCQPTVRPALARQGPGKAALSLGPGPGQPAAAAVPVTVSQRGSGCPCCRGLRRTED